MSVDDVVDFKDGGIRYFGEQGTESLGLKYYLITWFLIKLLMF